MYAWYLQEIVYLSWAGVPMLSVVSIRQLKAGDSFVTCQTTGCQTEMQTVTLDLN